MMVGEPGVCIAKGQEIISLLHDLQNTTVPAPIMTHERVEGAVKAPVRVWKGGVAAIQVFWMTQLGTGEGGEVQYLGIQEREKAPAGAGVGMDEEEEEWNERLSTEVLVLRVHQAWVPKSTWKLWAPAATRVEVAKRWLAAKGVSEHVEDVFHPKVFGEEPTATATISLRVSLTGTEEIVKLTEKDPGDATF